MSARKARGRRQTRRLGRKSARQKEKRALDGATPELVRGESWALTLPQPPLVDDTMPHRKKRGKRRRQKEHCPAGGSHEWYHEWEERRDVTIFTSARYQWCDDCNDMYKYGWWPDRDGEYRRHYCLEHERRREYTERCKVSTCLKCWTVRKRPPSRIYDDGMGRWNYRKKLTLKRRPVKLDDEP